MYQIKNDLEGNPTCIQIVRNGITFSIPFVEDNTDYQEYLAWLAEGNEPLPADSE